MRKMDIKKLTEKEVYVVNKIQSRENMFNFTHSKRSTK